MATARAPLSLCLLIFLASGPAAAASGPTDRLDLELSRLNRTYVDAVEELPPAGVGGLVVRLESPESTVTLLSHRVELRPAEDGLHRFRLEVEVEGRGRVEVHVETAGAGVRLEDEVVVPRQRRQIEGRCRIERDEAGYLLTPTELPRVVRVELESRLAGRLVAWCGQMSVFLPLGVECVLFERLFRQAPVPLPAPGETLLLPYEELTPEERAALDAYLARAGGGASSDRPAQRPAASARTDRPTPD